MSYKMNSHDLELLDKYTKFLLDAGYVDCDVFGEGVDWNSSINEFIKDLFIKDFKEDM